MKTSCILKVVCFALGATVCVSLSGCVASHSVKYYRLELPSPLATNVVTSLGVTLQVGTLDSPPIMRDGRILYQVGAHEVGAYEYHRWVETPDRMVQDSLVRMLRASGKYQSVDTPRSGVRTDYIVQGRLYEFSEVDKPEIYSRVSLEVELHDAKDFRIVWSRFYNNEERVSGKEVPDVVDSLDKNLRKGLSEIVVGLDQFFAAKLPSGKPEF